MRANEAAFRSTLEKLNDLPIVGDVRGDGYFYGIELVKDKATRETFDDDESERLLRGFLSHALFDAGLICRADDRGDPVIQLSPPLTCGPGALRRDGADPAQRADGGLGPALARSTYATPPGAQHPAALLSIRYQHSCCQSVRSRLLLAKAGRRRRANRHHRQREAP